MGSDGTIAAFQKKVAPNVFDFCGSPSRCHSAVDFLQKVFSASAHGGRHDSIIGRVSA